LPFHTVQEDLKARILKWIALPSSVGHILSDFSTMTAQLGRPHRAWLSFIELQKAVVLVSLNGLDFFASGFSVSAPDAVLQNLLSYVGFSYLGMGYLFTAIPAKHSHCSLPWTRYISSLTTLLTLNVQ